MVAGEDGHHGQPEEAVLQPAQGPSKISVLNDGDMRLDQVKIIARRIGVTETDVIYMNRRLGGDASLNAAIREDDNSGEWQDWLVDESRTRNDTRRGESSITVADAARCARRAQQARAAHLRTRRSPKTDHARGAGRGFGVSRERVRQIEVSAFEKVQDA